MDVDVEQQWGLADVLHYRCIVLQRKHRSGMSEEGGKKKKTITGPPETKTDLPASVQRILSKSLVLDWWSLRTHVGLFII